MLPRFGFVRGSRWCFAGDLDDVGAAGVLDSDIDELILQISRAENPDIETGRAWVTTTATVTRRATYPGFAPGMRSRFDGS
jgi:hypothetical protein